MRLLAAAVRRRNARASSFVYIRLCFFLREAFCSFCFISSRSSSKSGTDTPLWGFGFSSTNEARSPSEDRPSFFVTTHSYALPSWKSPEIMALNLVTDIVFSNRRQTKTEQLHGPRMPPMLLFPIRFIRLRQLTLTLKIQETTNHGEITSPFTPFKIHGSFFGNWFYFLKPDPETTQAKDKPIQALDKEQDNADIGQELEWGSKIFHPNQNPLGINPIKQTLNRKRVSESVEGEEDLYAGEETGLDRGILRGGSVGAVGPPGGDAAAHDGGEAEQCGGDGGETAGGFVRLEEEHPSELLGVFVPHLLAGPESRH
nr:hypothetical protein Iba_chr15fCG3990 [Ipomoea batatas]